MKHRLATLLLVLGALLPVAVQGATVTASCKDGTSFSGDTRKGACAGHGGVKAWGTAAASTPTPGPTPSSTASTTSGSAASAAPAPGQTATTSRPTPSPSAKAAAGGGPGQVWVNSSSKVYHCAGSKWYGKTKGGQYMSEAQAKAAGFHAEHGKTCTS